jgi:hypothetical protein
MQKTPHLSRLRLSIDSSNDIFQVNVSDYGPLGLKNLKFFCQKASPLKGVLSAAEMDDEQPAGGLEEDIPDMGEFKFFCFFFAFFFCLFFFFFT